MTDEEREAAAKDVATKALNAPVDRASLERILIQSLLPTPYTVARIPLGVEPDLEMEVLLRHEAGKELLRARVADIVERGEPIPEALRELVVDALREPIRRSRRYRRDQKYWFRNAGIVRAIGEVVKLGFTTERACAIVADAIAETGDAPVAEAGVAKIWERYHRLRAHFGFEDDLWVPLEDGDPVEIRWKDQPSSLKS